MVLLLFSLQSHPPVYPFESDEGKEAGKEFPSYNNLLPNSEMEKDDDLDNIPDEWNLYSWLPEGDDYLREAVMRYLDLEVPEIGVSMERRRRAFLGERSVRLFTPSGKIGPGIWTTLALSPGLYTLNLVARSTGDDERIVATFLAQEGKLTQVDRKWRWVHHSELIPYSTPQAVISVNDWTFRKGGILVDHVSLVKIPFEIGYEKTMQLVPGENQYVIEIKNMPYDILPLGANLELQEPSGTITRKNIELDVTEEESRFVFTIDAEDEGEYSVSMELYNPRTTSILFSDEGIKAYLRHNEAALSPRRSIRWPGEGFFPVGISIKGYELDALEGKGMNVILLKDPRASDIENVISKAQGMGLSVMVEINATDSSHLSADEKALVEICRRLPGCVGYSLLSGWGSGVEKNQYLRQVVSEMRELDPEKMLILRNYLPGPIDRQLLRSVDGLFVDPFPITEPLKPLYTISQWIQRARRASNDGTKCIAVVQVFAGWPYAKKAPTLDQMRTLSRLALNRGVDGIIFHTFSGDFPYFNDPVASNWDVRREQAIWTGIGELAKEIEEFHSRFGKPHTVDIPVKFIPEGVLDVAYFEAGNSLSVQVVNVTPVSIGIRSISPSYHEYDTIGVIPAETSIKCGEGFFEDSLQPFEVKMYSLSALFPGDYSIEASNNLH